jgi:hypothetical protein
VPSGENDHKVLTFSRNAMFQGATDNGQMVVSASVIRDEATGTLDIDFQYSVQRGKKKSDEGLNLIILDGSGQLQPGDSRQVSPSVEKCLMKLKELQ